MGRLVLATVIVGLLLSGSAGAAYVCHPDPAGSARLTIHGNVGAYSLVDGTVTISVRHGQTCTLVTWRPVASTSQERPSACVAARPALQAIDGSRRIAVVHAPGGADRPDRINVYARPTEVLLHSWPLFNRPLSLDVDGDVAVFTTANRDGFYGLRLSDGRIALIGVNQRVDVPQINGTGIVYQDDLYKRDDGKGRVVMKFVPRTAVEQLLERAGTPVATRGIIRDFSADRQRVAVAVADPRGFCDRILFWNTSWNYVSRLTSSTEATCTPGHGPGGITRLALGGITAEWVTAYGRRSTVLAANIIACREWVITRLQNGPGGDSVGGIAADGVLLAYAVGRHERELRGQSSLSTIRRAGVYGRSVADGGGLPVGVSVDSWRIATLRQDGSVDVRTRTGALISTVRPDRPRAIALRKDTLAVLTADDRLQVFDVRTRRLVHSWRVPEHTRAEVDLHFGVAVVSAGRRVFGIDTANGRTALLTTAPAAVRAQIEAPGVVYQFNDGGHGFLRVVPFAQVENALR